MENKKICSECRGDCCKRMPGATVPDDFNNDKAKIILALKTGNFAIDYWDGHPLEKENGNFSAYYIRPRTKKTLSLFDPSWGGECIFLSKNGCKLKHDKRPKECRDLMPSKKRPCNSIPGGCDKKQAAILWLPFHDFLVNIKNKL